MSLANHSYGQGNTSASENSLLKSEWLDMLMQGAIAILVSILGVGITAFATWLRKRGVPLSDEQETMFRSIVTNRFEKLAKESWTEMRTHPEKIDDYWRDLSKGNIPDEFQSRLRKEGFEFAMELKNNKEFRDFASKISETGMEELLKDLRTNLKSDYQRRMLDVIPKRVSTAVDSAFDPKVVSIETWSKNALENLKPLLLSTEAIDNEKNLMIIIKAEINRRLQTRLGLPSNNEVQ